MQTGSKTIKLFLRQAFLFALLSVPLIITAQSIAINEVMSSNSLTMADQDGDFEDWVELNNFGTEAVDLKGFGLSDDPQDPFRWIFPSVVMEPGEHLIVWASGKDRRPEAGWINALMREVYHGIEGENINDLVNHSSYPDAPSKRHLVTVGFEAPVNIGNHYGQRMQAYIEAPVSGDYVFWISSDDKGALYLSTSEDPGDTVEIASVPEWTNPREWNKYPVQQSSPVTLEEGKKYYIMALMKEHEGGDNLAVRWRLPSGTIEEPISNQRLFWNETELHTNFRINREGEELLLTSPGSVIIDEIPPIELHPDMSYGRYPDGTGEFFYYTDPTPGEPNHDNVHTELPVIPDPPVFSRKGGTYTSSFLLGFEYGGGLEVYYTTDGSLPVAGVSTLYTGPFSIAGTTLVRAISHEPGAASSKVVKELYTELTDETRLFDSNLPLIILHQFDIGISPENRTPAYITILDNDEDGRTRLDSEPALQGRTMINIRGSSSLEFPKNMYGFHLLEEDGSNRKEPLLGMPEEHNWILYAPYSDKSLMRNVIAYGLGNDIGRYSPRTRFVELFLHGGDGPLEDSHYHGVYVLTERIKWADGRVDITKIDIDDNQEPEISGGYIIKKDRFNEGEAGLRTQRGTHLAFVRPQERDVTPQQKSWLEDYLSRFESALFGDNLADYRSGYVEYIDPDSFIDAHLITELLKEIDGYRLSTFMHKDRNGRLNMGPLWDFNLSLGNADYNEGWKPEGWYYPLINESQYMNGWYNRLFSDPEFTERYHERWWQLRRGQFSDDSLRSRINENAQFLDEAQERNFERWPILGEYIWPNWYIAPTYDHEIAWMTDWLMARTRWIDQQLGKQTTPVHFWHFNDLPANNVFNVVADHSVNSALISYEGSGDGYMDRVNDGTLLNADLGSPAGRALRVRNPSDSRELIFSLPTTGFKDVVFRYMVKRTTNGARKQTVYYRTSDIDGWSLYSDTLKITETYQQFRLDFEGVKDVDDNPGFSIRILFHGEEATGASGNNRFDNISLDGYNMSDDNEYDPGDEADAYHYNSQLFVNVPNEGTSNIEVFNLNGRVEARFVAETAGIHTFSFSPPSGIYILRMISDNHIFKKKFLVFK